MRVGLLGPLEVHDEAGRAITVGGPRLRALLIRLALDPGRLVGAAALADAVWPTGPPPGAANALQALVSRLRRLLPPGALVSQPAGYLLAVEPWAVDAVRFEALAARGRAAASRDPLGAAAILREALALWRGAALVDVATADFARSPVARLTELRLSALEDRCAADLAAGAAPDVIPELRALVAAQPLRERSAGLLIRALASAGRPAEALAAYERCRAAFAETLGTEPSPALAALHLAVLRGEPPATAVADGAPVSAAPGAGGGQGNLPAPLTTFVGRDHEVTRVAKLVAESRLTTLTGPGGAGKTRLATECARTALPDLPDGAWLVELAPILDPAEVPLAALSALGLRERPLLTGPTGRAAHEDPDPVARLAVGIAGRHLLLVLDNCEHVIGAAAALADRLLARCPHLRVLTTSREPLGITGETLWPVEPLALPPADAPPGEALGYPAVRLLADRAQAVRPDFAVDDRTVRDVVTICRALDGMPLAIELAAARLRALPVREVAARLDDRFRLLTAGSRTARPRHQTLRAVVDWSWDLLDEAERALWRGLAVFAGGATVAAAERVCAGPGLPAAEVLDRLAALVDKSLVVAMPDGRYGMLETIRAYGLERLVEAGAEDALRRAHATAFLALAEELAAGLRGGEQLGCLARLTADHDNVHAALRWAIAAGDAALATRFAAALGWYWWLRGRRGEGADLAAMAFALTGPVPPAVAGLAYALAAMNVAGGRSDVARAHRWLTRAAALARRAGP
ncbi:MAG TPA: BTAD domain-containing putative transcriptional regulator, partial [Pilimelia sp.]|nr:BTAD domain-containing putative transcriptional regulator [Pilimelia sp.]